VNFENLPQCGEAEAKLSTVKDGKRRSADGSGFAAYAISGEPLSSNSLGSSIGLSSLWSTTCGGQKGKGEDHAAGLDRIPTFVGHSSLYHLYVPDCYLESGKGEAAIKSQAFGAL
jgi:hypothetical protein